MIAPAFSAAHGVWFSAPQGSNETLVSVEAFAEGSAETQFSAPLDARTASFLANLCGKAHAFLGTTCLELGRDGVWYRLARATSPGRYEFISFWSPSKGTASHALAHVAETLRDYATAPPVLRREQWRRLNDAGNELEDALAD